MNTRLSFQDPATIATGMLTVFAVDIATGKGADPIPVLLCTSDEVASAAERVLHSGEFKAGSGRHAAAA